MNEYLCLYQQQGYESNIILNVCFPKWAEDEFLIHKKDSTFKL